MRATVAEEMLPGGVVPAGPNNSSGGPTGSSGNSNHRAAAALVDGRQLQQQQPPSRYECQKRRDWNTFGQYLRNHRPPLELARCSGAHVLEFLRYLDQFGKTKVHAAACPFFGRPHPPAPCPCPLRQAWGSLDALIGRLRAAFEENGGSPEANPFAARAVRLYLREIRDTQSKARGITYEKKKRKRPAPAPPPQKKLPAPPPGPVLPPVVGGGGGATMMAAAGEGNLHLQVSGLNSVNGALLAHHHYHPYARHGQTVVAPDDFAGGDGGGGGVGGTVPDSQSGSQLIPLSVFN